MPQGKGGEGNRGSRQKSQKSIPVWEWSVSAFGAALVIGSLAFMGYQALGVPDTPPSVFLQAGPAFRNGRDYLLPFTARNTGRRTAAQVIVEGRLSRGGEIVETARATIDYLPPRSERKAGLFFARNPADFRLELRALGYQEP